MLVDFIVGARPNFMKLAPIYSEYKKLKKKPFKIRIIHTGQHSDYLMSDIFIKEFKLSKIDYFIKCIKDSHYHEIFSIMEGYQNILNKKKPNLVVVFGDINSTLSISIVAKKNNLRLCHIEGGLRSFDMTMPEEINRIVTDSLTDYYFTTSVHANKNLIHAGVPKKRIFFVGNTMIDNLINNLNKVSLPDFFYQNKIKINDYLLLTLHRPSNTDNIASLKKILNIINNSLINKKIIFLMHPRYLNKISKSFIRDFDNIIFKKPLGYHHFIGLLKNSLGIITDSGGITEEATYLKKPCLTLRTTTERPETIIDGSNILIGNNYKLLNKYIKRIIKNKWKKSKIPNKWDGKSSVRILKYMTKIINYEK